MLTKILDTLETLQEKRESTWLQRLFTFLFPVAGVLTWIFVPQAILQKFSIDERGVIPFLPGCLLLFFVCAVIWFIYVIFRRIISYIIFEDSFELVARTNYLYKEYCEDLVDPDGLQDSDIFFDWLLFIFLILTAILPIFSFYWFIWCLAGRRK